MGYEIYNVQLILNDEQEERLKKLEKQFKKINGWSKEEIMQFGISALPQNTEIVLAFLEIKADNFTSKWFNM